MVTLRLQRRLASSVLKCGKNKVWMDNKETSEIALATTRSHVKKLVKDGIILRRAPAMHSRFRTRQRLEEKRKGRHTGIGKRRGCKEARMPVKVLWMRRQRILRRLLRKLRLNRKIDRKLYHKFYLLSKGNQYKNKKVLLEAIFKDKKEKIRTEEIEQDQDRRRNHNMAKRAQKLERRTNKA